MSRQQARAAARRSRQDIYQRGPRKPNARPRYWIPMSQSSMAVDAQMQELAKRDSGIAALLSQEIWIGGWADGNEYVVTVRRFAESTDVMVLSIRRVDRKAVHDWRDFQRIKNEIAGPDIEAFEIYPARKRTMDQANQYWIWCLPRGQELPVGIDERIVRGENDPQFPLSRQRPFTDKEERDAI